MVIHRVVSIDADDVVTTKGDAYKEADPFDVPRSALTTKLVATVPAAGRLLGFLGSGLGLLWLAGGGLLFIGMPLLERYRDSQRRHLGERESIQTTLRGVTDELALLRAEHPPVADVETAYVADVEGAVVAELRAIAAEERGARDAAAAELRAMVVALAERDAIAAEERRAENSAAAEREAALAEELRATTAAAAEREAAATETLQAVTASFTECLEAANRRAETEEEQLRAHLEQLPAQIERAVALAIAAHTPPPPPATRSSRFVAASHRASAVPAAWDAPNALAGVS